MVENFFMGANFNQNKMLLEKDKTLLKIHSNTATWWNPDLSVDILVFLVLDVVRHTRPAEDFLWIFCSSDILGT